MNSEIREGVDCSYNNMNINVLDVNNGRFMDKCDLDLMFKEKYEDLCNIYGGKYKKSSSKIQYSKMSPFLRDKVVIKPVGTAVIIETKFCDEKVHTTQINP